MIRILWLRTFDLIVTDLKWNNLWYEIRIWWWSFWSVLSGFGLATVVSQFCSANIWCWSPHLWQILCLKSCELYPISMYVILQIVFLLGVKEKGMAGNQVKKFQQLQEQRTQAFHELGIKASSKKISVHFLTLYWFYSQQINITKSSFAMLQNMRRVLKNSRRGSGIVSCSRKVLFKITLLMFSPQWSNWEVPENLTGDNWNQEIFGGTRSPSDAICLHDCKGAGNIWHAVDWHAVDWIVAVLPLILAGEIFSAILADEMLSSTIEWSSVMKLVGWWNLSRSWKRRNWAQLLTSNWQNNRWRQLLINILK